MNRIVLGLILFVFVFGLLAAATCIDKDRTGSVVFMLIAFTLALVAAAAWKEKEEK